MTPSMLLVSNDNSDVSELVSVLRGRLGYHVDHQKSGEAGIQVFRGRESTPALVLLSPVLGDMSPVTFLHVLQQVSPSTPVLMVAREDEEVLAVEMISGGALNYLNLPSSMLRIKATIENALYVRALRETVHWLELGKAPMYDAQMNGAGKVSGGDRPLPVHLLDDNGDVKPLVRLEEELIKKALIHHHGQVSMVARQLRIGRSTLYRKIEQYQLQLER